MDNANVILLSIFFRSRVSGLVVSRSGRQVLGSKPHFSDLNTGPGDIEKQEFHGLNLQSLTFKDK